MANRVARDTDSARRETVAPSGEAIPSLEVTLAQLGATLLSRLYEMCKPVEMAAVGDYRKTVKVFGTDKFHLG